MEEGGDEMCMSCRMNVAVTRGYDEITVAICFYMHLHTVFSSSFFPKEYSYISAIELACSGTLGAMFSLVPYQYSIAMW